MKNLAIVGCGFVSNYYMLTLSKSSSLKVMGVLDRIDGRAQGVAQKYGISKVYGSLAELLEDGSVDIVLNLTNPRDHYEVSKACIEAGKHVYTEKPLAMQISEARELAELAES